MLTVPQWLLIARAIYDSSASTPQPGLLWVLRTDTRHAWQSASSSVAACLLRYHMLLAGPDSSDVNRHGVTAAVHRAPCACSPPCRNDSDHARAAGGGLRQENEALRWENKLLQVVVGDLSAVDAAVATDLLVLLSRHERRTLTEAQCHAFYAALGPKLQQLEVQQLAVLAQTACR